MDSPFPTVLVDQLTAGIAAFVDVTRRGKRFLVDKDDLEIQLNTIMTGFVAPIPRPSAAEFRDAVGGFWHEALRALKMLHRGELYVAHQCCDVYMKQPLLQILEWHARAAHNWELDSWHEGRFLEKWADRRAVGGLRHVFAHYDVRDVRRALLETVALFRWVARETACRLGYAYVQYVQDAEAGIGRWIDGRCSAAQE